MIAVRETGLWCVHYHGNLCTAADLAGHVSLLSPCSMDCTRFVMLTMISKQYENEITTIKDVFGFLG